MILQIKLFKALIFSLLLGLLLSVEHSADFENGKRVNILKVTKQKRIGSYIGKKSKNVFL